jgi:hypothetical protein
VCPPVCTIALAANKEAGAGEDALRDRLLGEKIRAAHAQIPEGRDPGAQIDQHVACAL